MMIFKFNKIELPILVLSIFMLISAFFEEWSIFLVASVIISIPLLMLVYKKSSTDNLIPSISLILYIFIILLSFTMFYREYGLLNGTEIIYDFQSSLYFSIVTWTTLGYGDFQPTSNIRLVAAFQAIFGYIFMSIYIAIFFNAILRANDFKKLKPVRKIGIEKTYNLVGLAMCGLEHGISLDKTPKNAQFFVDKYEYTQKEFEQFLMLNSVGLGLDLMSLLSQLSPILKTLKRKMEFSFIINEFPTGAVVETPLHEIEIIEGILKNIQLIQPNTCVDDRALNVFGPDIIENKWSAFCKEYKVLDPKTYDGNQQVINAFDIQTAAKIINVKEGDQVRPIFKT
jgi:hypothetical protein